MIPGRLALVYLLVTTSPAYSVDCGRAISQFNFKAEDLRTFVMQSDQIVQMIKDSPNTPPQRAAVDWLVPFIWSIEAARTLVTIHRLAPECFGFGTKEIENGIADREKILNTITAIVRGQMRGLKPP